MKAALIALALLVTPAVASTITPISIPIDPNAGTVAGLNWTYNGTFASPFIWAANTPIFSGSPPDINWIRLDFQFTTPLAPLAPNAVGVFAIVNLVLANPPPAFGGSLSGPLEADGLLAINNFAGVIPNTSSQFNQGTQDFGGISPAPRITLVSASFAYLFGNPPLVITGYQLQVGTILPGIPEPSTWALLLFGFAFVGLRQIWPGATHG